MYVMKPNEACIIRNALERDSVNVIGREGGPVPSWSMMANHASDSEAGLCSVWWNPRWSGLSYSTYEIHEECYMVDHVLWEDLWERML